MTTEWSQRDPCNRLSPTIDGKHTPAGCVPVAIGQVVAYHKTLTTKKNIDWNKIANENGDEIAKLIQTIGNEVKMVYSKEYAHPNINFPNFFDYRDRVKNFLNANGYSVKYVDNISSTLVCPSIIEGFTKNFLGTTNWFGGHWWVMDGYEKYEIWRGCGTIAIRSTNSNNEPLQVWGMLYLHFNWGWEGQHNGWYGVSSSYRDYCKSFRKLHIVKKREFDLSNH